MQLTRARTPRQGGPDGGGHAGAQGVMGPLSQMGSAGPERAEAGRAFGLGPLG
jgi:hypothetical protein